LKTLGFSVCLPKLDIRFLTTALLVEILPRGKRERD